MSAPKSVSSGTSAEGLSALQIVRHAADPSWGRGYVVDVQGDKLRMVFEGVGTKVFKKNLAKVIEPVDLPPEEAASLIRKLQGKLPSRSSGAPKGKAPAPGRSPVFPTFEAQRACFERLFPGGFLGEVFTQEERGSVGVKGKAGYKEAAIAAVREQFSFARFQTASAGELFQSMKSIIGLTNLAHPMEGSIAYGSIEESARPAAVRGLQGLLHGEGDYADRLETFVDTLRFMKSTGEPRTASWPAVTIWGALYFPSEEVCVKPTVFASQAAMLGRKVNPTQPIRAKDYRQCREVALQTQALLLAAGHQPRDLMDVYSFIWRTHAEKPAVDVATELG